MTPRRRRALAIAVGLGVVTAATTAHAQLSGSLAVDTDVRLRGISITGRDPALTLAATYDDPSGLYLGASAVLREPGRSGAELVGHAESAGYAFRTSDGLAVDLGLTNQDYRLYGPTTFRLRYSEAYAGVSRDGYGVRVYVSPNYLRAHSASVYLETSAVFRPAERWRLTARGGIFKRLSGAPSAARPTRYDVALGVAREFRRGEVRLTWATAFPAPPPRDSRSRPALAGGASLYF